MSSYDPIDDNLGVAKQSIAEVASAFLYCFTTELNRVRQGARDENAVASIIHRFDYLSARRKPFFMFGPTELTDMSSLLFGEQSDESFTDFVLKVTIRLQAQLIRDGQDIMELCRDLANSLTILEENAQDSANSTAKVYSDRFSSMETILKTLKTNRWMLTVLLGNLFAPELVEAFSVTESAGKS